MKKLILIAILSVSSLARAESWPAQPELASDPGSATYQHQLFHEVLTFDGRSVDFYAPQGFQNPASKLSVIIYGHGQAIPVTSYQSTFEHLAKKGVAVIFPQFDTGFFDQDWRRMAADYVKLASQVFNKYPNSFDASRVVFSGHSKGAYVALVALGLPQNLLPLQPAAAVFFDPAGFDAEYLQNVDPRIPITLTWADRDTVIKESLVQDIYNRLPSQKKQLIRVKSYQGLNPDLPADHFFPLTKKFSFGGRDGVSPLHYFGSWKWMLGAAWDLESGGAVTNPYLYGEMTAGSGVNQGHTVQKSW